MKRLIAILSVFAVVLTLVSCGKKDAEKETEGTSENTVQTEPNSASSTNEASTEEAVTESTEPETDDVSESATEASTDALAEATDNTESTSAKPDVSSTAKPAGLNSTSAKEIVDFYKAAAKNTSKDVSVNRNKQLVSLDGGKGAIGSILSALESAGKKALAKGSGVDKGLRGHPELLTASDIASAKAVVNGNYTNITMNIKDYTASDKGRADEGSVGHAIGVLDTIDDALKELPLTIEDTSKIKLVYSNAKVTAKVDNKTNKIVNAHWVYDVTIYINDTEAKLGIKFTLDGAVIKIRYEASM